MEVEGKADLTRWVIIKQHEGVAEDCGRRKRDCRYLAGADSRMLSSSLALGLVAGGCARGALFF